MPKITIADLKRIKEEVQSQTSMREGKGRARVTVHMGTCGIAAGARIVMDALIESMNEADARDIIVKTSGCAGFCSQEPMVTVEIADEPPVIYSKMDANKMRQVFKRHVLGGEVQSAFALARG